MPKPGRPTLYGSKMKTWQFYLPDHLRERIIYAGGSQAIRDWAEKLPPAPDKKDKL